MTDRIIPNSSDLEFDHSTSLEAAYAQATENLTQAEAVLKKARELRAGGDGSGERIAQLERLRDAAQAEVERTRGDL